jgi:Holliday junction resolvase RusA-like endonuclease
MSGPSLRVVVYGSPKPAGSKRAFKWQAKDGRSGVSVTDANPKAKGWKGQVAQVVGEKMAGRELFDGPLALTLHFYVARPRGHFGKSGLSAKGRRTPYPAVRPDVLKLARGVEDAMSGVVYRDDAQIVVERLVKEYGEPERVEIVVEALPVEPTEG